MPIELAEFCTTVQQSMEDIATQNYPAMKRQQVGLLESLVSAENRAGFRDPVAMDPGNGKDRRVIIEHFDVGCPEDGDDTSEPASTCEEGSAVNTVKNLFELTNYRRTPVIEFTETQMRAVCQGSAEYRAMTMGTYMNAFFKQINGDLNALAIAGAGGHYGGATGAVSVPMIGYGTDGQEFAVYQGEVDIIEEMSNIGIGGRPFAVGAGNLSRYAKYRDIGCCNDYGQDVSQFGGFGFYRDSQTGAASSNANDFLVYAPGAMQFVSKLNNRGEFVRNTSEHVRTVMRDPITGLEVDFDISVTCEGTYRLMYFLNFGLYVMPTTMYDNCEGDGREGTNNVFIYHADTVSNS